MVELATIERAKRAFADRFGGAPDLIMQAPGRVNLIGEHTDYNDGFVLPLAIDRGTVVAARRARQGVHIVAADLDEEDQFTLTEPIRPAAAGDWRNYPRGMIAMLGEAGIALPALNLAIAGDVPRGAGLSSSASLEVAVGLATAALAGFDIDPTHLAKLAQRAESVFAGCACGIMDQLVSARAKAGHALLIDCRSLACRPVPVPENAAVLIVHSGVRRGLVDSAYNERRRQCELAAAHFGVPALRDVAVEQLDAARGLDPLVRRRARHVVTEKARTLAAADALSAGDLKRLGALIAESHASMRDDFEITLPAIDELVDMLRAEIGEQGGARMTGGGFGGCVVAVMDQARLGNVVQAIRRQDLSRGAEPRFVHACRPAGSAATIA